MNFCEDLAKSEGLDAVQLDTAKPALHLVTWYQKQGYKIVGETKWEGKTYESWIFEKEMPKSNLRMLNESNLEATL